MLRFAPWARRAVSAPPIGHPAVWGLLFVVSFLGIAFNASQTRNYALTDLASFPRMILLTLNSKIPYAVMLLFLVRVPVVWGEAAHSPIIRMSQALMRRLPRSTAPVAVFIALLLLCWGVIDLCIFNEHFLRDFHYLLVSSMPRNISDFSSRLFGRLLDCGYLIAAVGLLWRQGWARYLAGVLLIANVIPIFRHQLHMLSLPYIHQYISPVSILVSVLTALLAISAYAALILFTLRSPLTLPETDATPERSE